MTSNSLSKADVLERATSLDFPSSVVEFFQGYLGQPVGGFPEPLRSNVIRNKPRIDGRPGASMQPLDFKKIKADLRAKFGKHITDVDISSYVMYPKVRTRWCIEVVLTLPRFSKNTKVSSKNTETSGRITYGLRHVIEGFTVSFPHVTSLVVQMWEKKCTFLSRRARL